MNKKYLILGYVGGFVVALLLFVAVAIIKFNSEVLPMHTSEAPDIDVEALSLVDLDGNVVGLAQYYGKPILLNFWATWCSPCVAEFPFFDKIDKEGRVQVITVSDEKIDTILKFQKAKGYSFIFLASTVDLSDYGISFRPVSYLIDVDGKVVRKISGANEAEIHAFINELQ